METEFKVGKNQVHEYNHPGKQVGKGVYCSPDINETEGYGRRMSRL